MLTAKANPSNSSRMKSWPQLKRTAGRVTSGNCRTSLNVQSSSQEVRHCKPLSRYSRGMIFLHTRYARWPMQIEYTSLVHSVRHTGQSEERLVPLPDSDETGQLSSPKCRNSGSRAKPLSNVLGYRTRAPTRNSRLYRCLHDTEGQPAHT